ncbi:MAG: host attachment protein [Hyphomicrobiales bacterium]|nr:host attachment protein [Hyphomicrobiales bacterium]
MTEMKIPQGAWVVVCDGRKALILENVGDAAYPDLRVRESETHDAPPTSALGTDSPGRVHQRFGAARSAVEQTDWHDREEEAFLRDLATRLDKAMLDEEAKGLVVVAPPRALGMIRKVYSQAVREGLIAEIDKDYTGIPANKLEQRLVGKRRR